MALNIRQRIENALQQWEKSCTIPPCSIYLGEDELAELDVQEGYITIRYAKMRVVEVAQRRHLGLGI